MLYIELLEPILPENSIDSFRDVTAKIVEILYEDFLFVKNNNDLPLLAASGNY